MRKIIEEQNTKKTKKKNRFKKKSKQEIQEQKVKKKEADNFKVKSLVSVTDCSTTALQAIFHVDLKERIFRLEGILVWRWPHINWLWKVVGIPGPKQITSVYQCVSCSSGINNKYYFSISME